MMTAIYRELAASLQTRIRQGQLPVGHKLPALRQFARQQGVSLNTALSTYRLLEAQGYLRTKAKSGFYVRQPLTALPLPKVRSFSSTATPIRKAELIARVHASALNPDRVPLGTAQLAPELIATQALTKSLQRAVKNAGAAPFLYSPAAGQPELLDALCEMEADNSIHLKPEELLICNGAMDAVAMALEACTVPGDTVLVASPCYSGLLLLLANMQRKVVEVAATADGFDLTRVEAILQTGGAQAMLITAVHQNPMGFTLPLAQRKQLVELATRFKTPLIEDDVFGECGFDEARPLPLKAFDQAGWVLYCNSFSKTIAAGFRIGWCAPGRFLNKLLLARSATNLSVNTPLQLALADFLYSGEYRRHLQSLRPKLADNMHRVSTAVARYFPSGTAISRPQGGYVLWVALPGRPGSSGGMELFEAAASQGINIVPGTVFSASNRYQNCIRLNTGALWNESVEAAIECLGKQVAAG